MAGIASAVFFRNVLRERLMIVSFFFLPTNVIFFAPGAKYILPILHRCATMKKTLKKTVWSNIFRLIIPYRKKFLWVVTLGLLSTGASLVEPLIYRVAINDVAGLFVRQARENAQRDLGLEPGEEDSIHLMIQQEVPGASQPAVHGP